MTTVTKTPESPPETPPRDNNDNDNSNKTPKTPSEGKIFLLRTPQKDTSGNIVSKWKCIVKSVFIASDS